MKSALVFFLVPLLSQAAEPHFNFAFARQPQRVDVQAALGSEALIAAACGADGSQCGCELRDPAGQVTERVKASYEPSGNYFRCAYMLPATPVRVRITGPHGFAGALLDVRGELSLRDLIDPSLDVRRVRSVARYTCEEYFLEKDGTSQSGFSCAAGVNLCGGNNSTFCLLEARRAFFVFGDTYSSNYSSHVADRLYGGGSFPICGMHLLQYSCSGADGVPSVDFGLFASQIGPWTKAVSLAPSPDSIEEFDGYAATPAANGECPPGLIARAVFRSAFQASDVSLSTNLPPTLPLSEVSSPEMPPPVAGLGLIEGGSCNGVRCVKPTIQAGPVLRASFAQDGKVFCVIPAELVP